VASCGEVSGLSLVRSETGYLPAKTGRGHILEGGDRLRKDRHRIVEISGRTLTSLSSFHTIPIEEDSARSDIGVSQVALDDLALRVDEVDGTTGLTGRARV
jgi:hypothetical protein